MAIFSDSQVTAKGHALISKHLAGKCEFKFTKLKAGDGFFDGDVLDLTELVNHRLDGKIVDVQDMGMFTELKCYLSNQELTEFMEFREVAVWAQDPDEGDILFSYANAGNFASPMGPFNGVWLHEEIFTMRVYTANAANIKAEIVPTTFATEITFNNVVSGINATNVQSAIGELAIMFNQSCGNMKDLIASHNDDPNAHVLTINDRESIPQDGTASTGTLVQILGRLAHMLRLIRGKPHWWVDPNGGNNGWSVTDGVLSNTVPFGEVVDGVLVFDDGFATVNDGIVDLT